MVAPTTPDLPSLLAWAQTVEQRLGQLSNDGSGNAPLAPIRGACAVLSSGRSLTTINTGTNPLSYIPFDSVLYDTNSIWSAANPTRLTVPAGVTRLRIVGSGSLNNAVTTDYFNFRVDKNRGGFQGQAINMFAGPANGAPRAPLITPVLTVTPGDYFEVAVFAGSTTSAIVNSNQTWLAMDILG